MNQRLPSIFLIGAAKCGTTAFASYLANHPNVFFSNPKEPNFFNTDHDLRYRIIYGAEEAYQTEQGYSRLFESATPQHSILMEGSVWYLYSKVAVGKILEFNPNARFIVMLRNPVDMVYSLHGQLYWSFCEEEEDFDTAWNLQSERKHGRSIPPLCPEPSLLFYKDVCSLGTQLEALYQQVEPEKIFTILFDDFVNSPLANYESALRFLDVPSDNRTEFERINENKQHRIRVLGRVVMRQGKFPWVRPFVWKFNIRYGKRKSMKASTRRYLTNSFTEEIWKMEEILGRGLDNWRNVSASINS